MLLATKQKNGIVEHLRSIGNCSVPPGHATRLQEQQKREDEIRRKLNASYRRRRKISSSEIASIIRGPDGEPARVSWLECVDK